MEAISSDKMETYHGYVRTPSDAIKLFEACRLGLLPRVQRRLSEKERQSIRSGSVFVWDEREAGMRRWTDGKSWSASRVSGSFLTYREMEGKRGGGFGSARRNNANSESMRGSEDDHDDVEPEGYRYKADGLMKQSFSITASTGQHLHLISYYSRPQPGQPELPQPSSDPALRAITPPKGMYPESSMGETNQTPALTRAPMQQPYMIAPHHPHGHPQLPYGAYPQHGYGWPPSPAVTPPYSHYSPYAHGVPHPPTGQHGPPPPQPPPANYGPGQHYTLAPPPPSNYDRPSLPPPQQSKPTTLAPYRQFPSPPRLHDSPRQKDATPSSGQGPLPALNSVAGHTSAHQAMTPPTRNHSVSPPRSSHSETILANGGHRPSLSSILPMSNGSAGNSPRGSKNTLPEKCGVSEDARALRMLDRKFCI